MMVGGVMMSTMVVPSGGKGRGGKHHQEQGGNEKLLHRANRSMSPISVQRAASARIKRGNDESEGEAQCAEFSP